MARLIDERPEDVEENDIDTTLEQEPQEPEATLEEPESDIPEKYQGKSTAEIVRMHQEAEKLLGKQSSEVGDLRKVVDDYIQTQLTDTETQATNADEEVDFFSDPDKAVERAINNHPKIKEAENISNQYRQSTAMATLQTKHPEMQGILQDEKFAEWIKGSKIRQQLFVQADQQFDYDDNFFSNDNVGFTATTATHDFEVGTTIQVVGQETNPAYNGYTTVESVPNANSLVTNKPFGLPSPVEGGQIYGIPRPSYNGTATITDIITAATGVIIVTNKPFTTSTSPVPGFIRFSEQNAVMSLFDGELGQETHRART